MAGGVWHVRDMNTVKACVNRLRNMLRRRGQRPEDAEDLVQEAFLRLAVYCNEGNEVRSPDAFLTRTVLNLAVNARESDRSHLRVGGDIEALPLVDLNPTPEETLAGEQCLLGIRRLLAGLGPRTRDVFFMHRLHGMSYAQIAQHFDISVSAVEKHIASAMAVLGPHMHKNRWRP